MKWILISIFGGCQDGEGPELESYRTEVEGEGELNDMHAAYAALILWSENKEWPDMVIAFRSDVLPIDVREWILGDDYPSGPPERL